MADNDTPSPEPTDPGAEPDPEKEAREKEIFAYYEKELTPETVDQTPDATLEEVTTPTETREAVLAELAKLSSEEYEARRTEAAKQLGFRKSVLDAAVAARRPPPAAVDDDASLIASPPEPWETEVNGAQLLRELAEQYQRYVILRPGEADMLALWTLHTYLMDIWAITPRLAIVSPQKRCGKTTLVECIAALACIAMAAANITAAALFRTIEAWRPTMLVDEADTFLANSEELRGIVNAGYRRMTAYVVRSVPVDDGWEPRKFSCFSAVAIALIGALPSTLADRSIHVRLRRKAPHETVARMRLDKIEAETRPFRRRCLRWAKDHQEALKESDPQMPDFLHDRAQDNWRSLCAIAEAVGGDWPARVRTAMNALAGTELDEETVSMLLLADIRQIFDAHPTATHLLSATILEALHALEERPWWEWGKQRKPLTSLQLANLLRPYEIFSKSVRTSDKAASGTKGYERKDFEETWLRYIFSSSLPGATLSGTPAQPSNGAGQNGVSSGTPSDTLSGTPAQMSQTAAFRDSIPAQPSNGAVVPDSGPLFTASQHTCAGVPDSDEKVVPDQNRISPASTLTCAGVPDENPEKRAKEKKVELHAGDWVYLLSLDGVQQNETPYRISIIATGPDGKAYARFVESTTGWPLNQCERTDPPPPRRERGQVPLEP